MKNKSKYFWEIEDKDVRKRSKVWTAGIIVVCFALAISIAVICSQFIMKKDSYMNPSSFLQGEYCVDDGEWKPIDPSELIDEPFHKIVFKGTMISPALNNYEEKLKVAKEAMPFAMDMHDTPGYKTQTMSMYEAKEEGVNESTEFTLVIVNPYIQLERYSDCFDITLSHGNGEYLKVFAESLPVFILALLVCFFGIFLFPIVSFILGKLNYRYITFGVLCIFWGVFMIGKNVSGAFNLWISDPALCMAVDVILTSLFFIPVMCYLKANMEGKGIVKQSLPL